jgi:preprotein translocase subunit YajC
VPALIIIVVLLGLMWLLLIRPQRRRQAEQQQLLTNLQVGDEIVTAGGLYGTIERVDDDEVMVEIAPQTTVRIAKRAVAAVLGEDEEEEPAEIDEEVEEEPGEEGGEPEELGTPAESGAKPR